MTIRHLKIFITVCDCGKMKKAADELYVSQPCVSQAIKELEDYYQIKLFERLSNRLYITEEGEVLLSYARHIVDSFENMELNVQKLQAHPKLRIGGSVSVGTSILGSLIKKLEEQHQTLETFVTINNTSEIESLLLKNKLDIAIVEGVVESQDIVQIPFYDDELVIVCGKTHPLYKKRNLKIADIEGQNFISREKGSADRNQLEQFLVEHDIHIVKKWNCSNTEAIKNAVVEGIGISILSKLLVENEVAEKKLKILKFEDLEIKRSFKLIYHKNKYISPQIKDFMDLCLSRRRRLPSL